MAGIENFQFYSRLAGIELSLLSGLTLKNFQFYSRLARYFSIHQKLTLYIAQTFNSIVD